MGRTFRAAQKFLVSERPVAVREEGLATVEELLDQATNRRRPVIPCWGPLFYFQGLFLYSTDLASVGGRRQNLNI